MIYGNAFIAFGINDKAAIVKLPYMVIVNILCCVRTIDKALDRIDILICYIYESFRYTIKYNSLVTMLNIIIVIALNHMNLCLRKKNWSSFALY